MHHLSFRPLIVLNSEVNFKQSLDTHGIKALFLRFRISVYTVLEGSFLTVSCRLVSVKAQKHQKYIKSHHL